MRIFGVFIVFPIIIAITCKFDKFFKNFRDKILKFLLFCFLVGDEQTTILPSGMLGCYIGIEEFCNVHCILRKNERGICNENNNCVCYFKKNNQTTTSKPISTLTQVPTKISGEEPIITEKTPITRTTENDNPITSEEPITHYATDTRLLEEGSGTSLVTGRVFNLFA